MDYKLKKDEKLCSRTAVNLLFDEGNIPKKRIRHAVGRVTLRRRVREAYRLNRRELLQAPLNDAGCGVDIAFVYLDNNPAPYSVINERMVSLLQRIAHAASEGQPPVNEEAGR